jgi:hypothetical protein
MRLANVSESTILAVPKGPIGDQNTRSLAAAALDNNTMLEELNLALLLVERWLSCRCLLCFA